MPETTAVAEDWPTRHSLTDKAVRVLVTVDGTDYQGWLEITQDEPSGLTTEGRYLTDGLKRWRAEVSGGLFATYRRGLMTALIMRTPMGHVVAGDAYCGEINTVSWTGPEFRSVFSGSGPLTITMTDHARSQA